MGHKSAGKRREHRVGADLCSFPDFFPALKRNVTVPVWGPAAVIKSACEVLLDSFSLSCVMFSPCFRNQAATARVICD